MKDIIVQEYYDKYKVKVVKEDMYLKKLPDGSATAYVGFRYDYEAYKVITSEKYHTITFNRFTWRQRNS